MYTAFHDRIHENKLHYWLTNLILWEKIYCLIDRKGKKIVDIEVLIFN